MNVAFGWIKVVHFNGVRGCGSFRSSSDFMFSPRDFEGIDQEVEVSDHTKVIKGSIIT